ncbi:MAG TPA: hypothetical protein VEJ38_02165 [Candidatus Acidoferrales bacterium]|nr:hypothetical protein [Candidatus Acidoferrales bacterium]
MTLSINGFRLELNVPDLRVAVRERLLQIVGFPPGHLIDTSAATDEIRASSDGRFNVILLDEGIDDLSIHRLIAALREDRRELLVAFCDGDRKWNDLPCEFGSGGFYNDRLSESPLVRAAAPYWRAMERAFAVTRETRKICTINIGRPPHSG